MCSVLLDNFLPFLRQSYDASLIEIFVPMDKKLRQSIFTGCSLAFTRQMIWCEIRTITWLHKSLRIKFLARVEQLMVYYCLANPTKLKTKPAFNFHQKWVVFVIIQ